MGSRRRGTSPAYDFTEWDANEQQPFTLSPCASSCKLLTQAWELDQRGKYMRHLS